MDTGKGGINEWKKLDIGLLADAEIHPRVHLSGDRSAHLHWTCFVCVCTVTLSAFGVIFFWDSCGFRAEGIANYGCGIHTHDRVLQDWERTRTDHWWVHALDVQSN